MRPAFVSVLVAFAAASSFAAAAEPAVVAKNNPNGITTITITPTRGGTPIVYTVDLSKHFHPATDRTKAIKRWESLRFGAFVCFNTSQFSGREICTANDPEIFNPPRLDPADWLAVFKKMGMKYAVLTTRHTSGFLLWNSPTTEFDVGSCDNKTDVVAEFVAECRKQNIVPGLYYCMWGGQSWKPSPSARAVILAQLHELTTKYGEIPYFWIDMFNWAPPDLSPQQVYDAIKSRQPQAIVTLNQHLEDGQKIRYFPTDVLNGEITTPPPNGHNPWRTINGVRYYLPFEFEAVSQMYALGDGAKTPVGNGCWFTYSEGRGFPASKPMAVKSLIQWIQSAYERGASNVLLSAAPDYTGQMRPEDVEQLLGVGKRLIPLLQAK